jgi:hypothetical protein
MASMSFSVTLAQDVVPVEPGSTVPLTVTITNRGDSREQFDLEIEGLDAAWTAVPVPVFEVGPGESRAEKVLFRIARESESLAGAYPFVVKVRSLESGVSEQSQGILEIRPFNGISAELSPKKGKYSPVSQQNSFTVTLLNLGNTPHTMQLTGNDPEDACAYEFESEHVTINPGQQREVAVSVKPRRSSAVASGRLIGFGITARSQEVPSVSAGVQGQLEQRALFSPSSLIAIMILAVIGVFWYINLPKPPSISLMLEPSRVVQGDTVTIRWKADPRSRVRIVLPDGTVVYEGNQAEGTTVFPVDQSDTLTFRATATRDGVGSGTELATLTIDKPEKVDPPTLKLSASTKDIALGEGFILNYEVGPSVVSATVAPLGKELDLTQKQLEIIPTRTGINEYTVSAKNKTGEARTQTVRVNVRRESQAKILAFSADRETVTDEDNSVTFSWQVTNAARVEFIAAGSAAQPVAAEGSIQIPVFAKTTFTLVATDADGISISRKVTVSKAAPTKPVGPSPDDGTSPGGGPTIETGSTAGAPPGAAPGNVTGGTPPPRNRGTRSLGN